MRRVVLACKTVEEELRPLLPDGVDFHSLEQGLHRTPDRLRESLQAELNAIEADEILLGYGLCGNGIAGLVAPRSRLIIPRVDDCISILLGSAERYREEFVREPGTYWLSNGWIQHSETDPYREYRRSVAKYGEETALWIAGEMMKGYRRLALIETGAGDMRELREYAHQFASFFQLEYVEVKGKNDLATSLLSGEWDNDRFVVASPGQPVSVEMFLAPLGIANG